MALAVNRTGTIFKKCDRSNHRPDTSKACAAGTCQHTCEPSAIEKCAHAWTLRYSVNGKQVEKSFRDKVQPSSACKFVLVGPANHAGQDGTGAFPSVATLVRYTGLSERTVRTCLDRLEAAGIVSPCDPGIAG